MGETSFSSAHRVQCPGTFSILERIDVGETCLPQRDIHAPHFPFSILERIDVGETFRTSISFILDLHALSVSSNGSTWVKHQQRGEHADDGHLSVSSNGSTWVKLCSGSCSDANPTTFSILERIDVGETPTAPVGQAERIPFSILERIDVGETYQPARGHAGGRLSVSSNGSTWVKPYSLQRVRQALPPFSILERIDVGETLVYRGLIDYFLIAFLVD